jgi:hypothetical protein
MAGRRRTNVGRSPLAAKFSLWWLAEPIVLNRYRVRAM